MPYIKNSTLTILVSLMLLSNQLQAYYNVGDEISQETRERVVEYCANAGENTSFSELLMPGPGETTRVLLLNFFASW